MVNFHVDKNNLPDNYEFESLEVLKERFISLGYYYTPNLTHPKIQIKYRVFYPYQMTSYFQISLGIS